MAVEGSEIRVKGSRILSANLKETEHRFVMNEGSSRSTKTFSLCQTFIIKGNQEEKKIFTITRKTGPALRGSVEADFIDFLIDYDLYNSDFHHKTNRTYHLNSNVYNFASVDQANKIKGLRHNYIWMNEADEFAYKDFVQFNIRLTNPSLDGKKNQIFFDFNPPDDDHWLYTKVYERPETIVLHSTYLDNPFLDEDSIREIEALKESDPEFWQVYGLGKRFVRLERIYPFAKDVDKWPDVLTDWTYGLDFGFNHPAALVRCGYIDGVGLYWKQEVYKSHLTGSDLIREMKEAGIDEEKTIYADPSRPDLIEEISNAGYTIEAAENTVYEGILKVKASKLFITDDSPDLKKEQKKYSWKKDPKTGLILDVPVKIWDDGMDAGRYGYYPLISDGLFIKSPKSKLIRRSR